MSGKTNWWAKGLLFENCSCQIVCPGHFHFTQDCTHDRCVGYWGIDVADGDFGVPRLRGLTRLAGIALLAIGVSIPLLA